MYEVRQADPVEVRDDLMRVWGNNLPVEDVARKFDWFYREAPVCPETVFVLDVSDNDEPARIVGTSGVGIREFSVNGEMIRAALLADLAVDTEHRKLLPALKLTRASHEYSLKQHPMLYGFPNQKAVGVFRRAGYKQLGSMARYARVLRHSGYIDRLAENDRVPAWVGRLASGRVLHSILGASADALRLAQLSPQLAHAARKFELEWLDDGDARIDALWEACKGEYRVIGRRSAAFLAWRFPADEGHRIVALVPRNTSDLRAYAVVHREGEVAHIRDLFGFPDDLQSLLERLVPPLYAEGATSMSMRYLGSSRVTESLEASGFSRREGSRAIIVDAVAGIEVGDVESWHLCDADEDV
jgi:hypothetical protein